MIANKQIIAAIVAALSLSAGAAFAQDSKNPLMPPKQPAAKPADAVAPAHSGAPTPDMKLPPSMSGNQGLPGAGLGNAGTHLGGLSVVAVVGSKAILRGSVGKSTNFALGGGNESAEAGKPNGGQPAQSSAPLQEGKGDDAAKAPSVTLIVTHAQPLQLAEGIWVRPDIAGTTVRLFQQPSKDKISGAAAEVLVYAASLETLSPTAPLAVDKGDDKKQDDKK